MLLFEELCMQLLNGLLRHRLIHKEAQVMRACSITDHAETSTGAVSDAQTLGKLAKQYNVLSIVDAVTSLGGVPLKVDEWQLDAVYSGSQKCLSCVPGLSPVTLSPAAIEKIQSRTTPVQSWFLDQSLVLGYWSGEGKRSYHHTAPVNSLYALHGQ